MAPQQADAGRAAAPSRIPAEELADWLTMKVAGYLNVPSDTIDVDTPLADCGIDSVLAMRLCVDLECEKGFAVETTMVWDYPTIGAIAAYLAAEQAAT